MDEQNFIEILVIGCRSFEIVLNPKWGETLFLIYI